MHRLKGKMYSRPQAVKKALADAQAKACRAYTNASASSSDASTTKIQDLIRNFAGKPQTKLSVSDMLRKTVGAGSQHSLPTAGVKNSSTTCSK